MEIWKPIKETDGIFEISNFGRYRTIDHYAQNRWNKKRFVKGKIRRAGLGTKKKYLMAAFYYKGKRWMKYIHHLVWEYFGDGSKSNHRITLDHIDNDSKNNHINNLRLITNRENVSKGHLLKENRQSKYTGVYWRESRNKWSARILFKEKRLYLGLYKDEFRAGDAYQIALQYIEANKDISADDLRNTVKTSMLLGIL